MKLGLSLVVDGSRPVESDDTQHLGHKSLFSPQPSPQNGSSHVKLYLFEGNYFHNRLELLLQTNVYMNNVIQANYTVMYIPLLCFSTPL